PESTPTRGGSLRAGDTRRRARGHPGRSATSGRQRPEAACEPGPSARGEYMLVAIQRRLQGQREDGFTLIELMVVVLIIAILIAIAIPTFLGARTKAQDRAAQVILRQGVLTAKTFYTDNQTFLDTNLATTATTYHGLEPSVNFVSGGAAAVKDMDVNAADASHVVLATKSASGSWYCI